MNGATNIVQPLSNLLEHLNGLYGYAMTLTGNPTDSEDLVQETYLRALRAGDKLRQHSNVKRWLFTILRNLWLNQLRCVRNNPRLEEFDEQTETIGSVDAEHLISPLDSYLAKRKRGDIKRAIESLPQIYREAVVLRDVEGLNYRKIAQVLRCPDGTVMSRLGRARGRLRVALQQWAPRQATKAPMNDVEERLYRAPPHRFAGANDLS
jgi:RNA polymerase sigma-70 factor, ECF subfamily